MVQIKANYWIKQSSPTFTKEATTPAVEGKTNQTRPTIDHPLLRGERREGSPLTARGEEGGFSCY